MGIWIWSWEGRSEPEIKVFGIGVALKTRHWIRDLDLLLTCKTNSNAWLGNWEKKCEMFYRMSYPYCGYFLFAKYPRSPLGQ